SASSPLSLPDALPICHTQYTAATGLQPLREAIARDYGERYGLDIAPSRIVVTAGASAALSLACCALVDPGTAVLLADPGYPCNRSEEHTSELQSRENL